MTAGFDISDRAGKLKGAEMVNLQSDGVSSFVDREGLGAALSFLEEVFHAAV